MKQPFKRPLSKIITLILIAVFLISGCATVGHEDKFKNVENYQVTDRDILEFNNHVRHMLRTKMKWSAVMTYAGSTLSLAMAATAATLGVTSDGGKTIIRAVAALSAGSLFSNDLLAIFNLRERAQAYQDGIALMEKAEARYFEKNARSLARGIISSKTMTPDGAELYMETIASITLVEKAMVNAIPTLEQVEKATGKHSHLKLATNSVNLRENSATTDILVIKNGPVVSAASDHPDLVDVDSKGSILKLKASETFFQKPLIRNIIITAVNAQGETAEVTVNPFSQEGEESNQNDAESETGTGPNAPSGDNREEGTALPDSGIVSEEGGHTNGVIR